MKLTDNFPAFVSHWTVYDESLVSVGRDKQFETNKAALDYIAKQKGKSYYIVKDGFIICDFLLVSFTRDETGVHLESEFFSR